MRRMISALLLVGGFNTGCIGLFNLNLLAFFLGEGTLFRLAYLAIGSAALVYLILLRRSHGRRLNLGPIGSSNL